MKLITLALCVFSFLLSSAQQIETPTGNISAANIKIGDKVIGYDPFTGVKSVNTVIFKQVIDDKFYSSNSDKKFENYIINGNYSLFSGQSLFANKMIVHAFELKKGDVIYTHTGKRVYINSISKIEGRRWYRFVISGDRTYVADGIVVHNATRFWVGGGSSANWAATANTNWAATTGGANNATVPTITDDVTFDGAGASGNTASTIGATISVLSLTFSSGYTQAVTLTASPTIAGNFTDNTAHTWTGASGLIISAASTITSGGKTFPNGVTFSNASTKVLSGSWTISGALSVTANSVLNWTTSETLSCAGLTASATLSGTAGIILTGGTWSGTSTVSNNLSFAGSSIVSGTVSYSTGTLTYTSGTITTTGSILGIAGSTTFNTSGITWVNVTASATATFTINSLLTATTLSVSTFAITFAGTSGFTVGTFTYTGTVSTVSLTLKNSVTYNITSALNACTSRPGILTFISNDATLKAILTITPGATCCSTASFTRIDASGGRTINTFNGTVTSSLNVNSFTDLKTVSKSFVN